MNKLFAILALTASAAVPTIGHSAEDPNTYAPLEMTTVTIRMTGGHPYGQLYPCPEGCALRLLPFTPDARIYVQGVPKSARELQDGQKLVGTVFLTSQPIDAIDRIHAE
ncbi:hypothetical protein PstZobell_05518 [Stutzerimonas stutzeri ATCC 14405 = CCUG 16156]|uniref:hypothetical protein n=1 Tax=Stutzerimonas TaxID=2901164 RepID=UPI0002548E5C|nr:MULTISPECIES: hypothetical protein [Stutzerimonas]EHY76883.1 hypothetical protein PstZobell_05518 [Stutzerimonas stutzeri ATCC 14405 = CCUG 16156]QOZ96957.1 hypothetical protein Pstu14405_17230 [Stutzerimonas stutzeri]